jgi:hypothetical protein
LPVPLLQPGKPVRATGADPVTIYAFDGGSGLSIRLNLKFAGEGALVLHAPDGTPMLERTGTGSIDLEAILPGEDVYYVSVLRAQTAQPGALRLEVTEPDLHLAVFAAGIGYGWKQLNASGAEYEVKSCWVEPGVKLRRIQNNGVEETVIGRGGKQYFSVRYKTGQVVSGENTLTFADGNVSWRHSDGRPDATTRMEDVLFYADDSYPYHRYLCTEADT